MNNNHRILLYLSLPISYLILVNLELSTVEDFAREDGLAENLGAICFLLAAFYFGYLFINSTIGKNIFFGKQTKRNIYFGLLALLFFVAFGEEISWGQRIFGWATPEAYQSINVQKETNIHNLWFWNTINTDGTQKSFFATFFTVSRLFSLFWLTFCVVVPFLHRYSVKAKKWIDYFGFPIAPFWIGGLFLVNFFIFHIANWSFLNIHEQQANVGNLLNEVKEAIYALLFFLLSLSYYLKSKQKTVSQLEQQLAVS